MRQQLSDDAPGRLVPYDRRPYYSPDPLPPDRELQLEANLYETLSEATFWLGRLRGFSSTTDFAPVLYTSLLRKEAMESSEIEGADIDYNALYSFETASLVEDESTADSATAVAETKDVQEVLNYERALENGIEALDRGDGISIDLLHHLHETLLTNVPDDRRETDTIGSFKTVPNHLGTFVPPVPSAVDGLMDALLTYVRTGGSYHPLVDIALVHYQFETIHPHGDGNGRLGRLLITLQLYEQEYLEGPTLSLSEYFNRYKATYVDRLNAVRTDGEWEAWIEFVVTGIRRQAEESLVRARELYTLQQEYEAEYGDDTATYARLACKLFEQPYLTAAVVQDLLDVTAPTAYRALERLEEADLLEETTGKERNREYRAREIFEILERPPQTY
ncbi:Fic family protein [Natrarchaeobius sp. A-rgal3]|uniref:Fic family protein n=1 Tax=Natrarchaeobius versutus TaxID=1679078 RepID=UPI0035106937